MIDPEIVFVAVAGFLGVVGLILGALPRRRYSKSKAMTGSSQTDPEAIYRDAPLRIGVRPGWLPSV